MNYQAFSKIWIILIMIVSFGLILFGYLYFYERSYTVTKKYECRSDGERYKNDNFEITFTCNKNWQILEHREMEWGRKEVEKYLNINIPAKNFYALFFAIGKDYADYFGSLPASKKEFFEEMFSLCQKRDSKGQDTNGEKLVFPLLCQIFTTPLEAKEVRKLSYFKANFVSIGEEEEIEVKKMATLEFPPEPSQVLTIRLEHPYIRIKKGEKELGEILNSIQNRDEETINSTILEAFDIFDNLVKDLKFIK